MASRRAAILPPRGRCLRPQWNEAGTAAAVLVLVALAANVVSYGVSAATRERAAQQPRPRRVAPVKAVAARPGNPVALLFGELSRCRKGMPERSRWRIAGVIHDESRRFGYDPLFVLALVEVESTCSPAARGPKGALGLIQIMPATARAVAGDAGLRWSGRSMLAYPTFNVRLGLYYLSTLERQFNDPRLALTAYNAGPARVSQMPRSDARRSHYVRRVLLRYEQLRRRAAGSW